MSTLRRHEGYLLIDHRASPGVSAEFVRASGKAAPFAGEGQMLEAPTITCSHCHQVLIVNPDRQRARGYCGKCDHYVCDRCEGLRVQTGVCRSMAQIFDEAQDHAARYLGREDDPAATPLVLLATS